MQNDSQTGKIQIETFHFIVLWRFGVIEESSAQIRLCRHFANNDSMKLALFSRQYLSNTLSNTIDDYAKNGGPEEVWTFM